jgi:hypothetical protein
MKTRTLVLFAALAFLSFCAHSNSAPEASSPESSEIKSDTASSLELKSSTSASENPATQNESQESLDSIGSSNPSSEASPNAKAGAEIWKDSNFRFESEFNGVSWDLTAVGTLPNSCYQFSHLDIVQKKSNEFIVTPYAVIRQSSMCLMVLKPVRVKLDLKTTLKSGGKYRFYIVKGQDTRTQIEVKIPK